MFKKKLCPLFFVSMIISSLMFISIAQAEIETYEGRGEYLRTDETIEYSKEQAKLEAERDVSRQVCMYIRGRYQNRDSTLDEDELFGDTESIIRIIDIKYKLIPEKENFIIRAIIKAEVDMEELDRLLNEK